MSDLVRAARAYEVLANGQDLVGRRRLAADLMAVLVAGHTPAMRFEDGAEVARQRAWGACEACGVRRDVMTHHRQPRQMGGVSGDGMSVNRPSALLRVCQFCNDQLEVQQRGLAYELGLIVRRPTVPAEVPVWLNTINGPGWWLLNDEGDYQWVENAPPDEVLAVPRVGQGH